VPCWPAAASGDADEDSASLSMSELSTLGLARSSDARDIAEMSRDLIEQGLTWSWTAARVQRSISANESSVVVARRERRLAAFAIMHFGEEVAHLSLLAVAPDHRRQGLGRQLMEWLTRSAVTAGVFRINLELRTLNEAARIFYERLGFEQREVVHGYYQGREAALRMSRCLAKNQC
jgi:[ribosomal protein S18]-alanine N-acetyltransferase